MVALRKQVLFDAAKAYAAKAGKEMSVNDQGGICLQPGDILISCTGGKLECNDPATKEALAEIIMELPQESKTIMPSAPRKSNSGQMKPVSHAVRDIQVADLTFDDIKTYICPAANDQEVMIFLKLCQARNLNPFLRDAYLIKYDQTKPAQIVVGKDAFTKKAEDHPKFAGYKAGIIVKIGDILERREGCFWMEGENLVGGWAEVYRADRKETPYKMEVPRKEYDTGKSNWVTKPATMIRKVALVQALREAFPSEFSGMYDGDELGIDPSNEVSST